MIKTICVAGAGTMGSGIALGAAKAGYQVRLFDTQSAALDRASVMIRQNAESLAEKGKISQDDKQRIIDTVIITADINSCRADLVIEAIIEKTEAKIDLFGQLAGINGPDCIYASNTSSLSITSIQEPFAYPDRMAGLHFFNPAHIMKLVEVVRGKHTSPAVMEELVDLCRRMDKTPVQCMDAPGFIVNRVARHYYLEALKMADSGAASFEEIDKIMEASGFKMGPFRLMDLIGMDINLAVSQSLYEAFNQEPRFKPSPLQERKVAAGELGRKTGRGFYDYSNK
jgi:3-hydroxybutyryl-CoA dehydrogenase